MLAAQDGFKVLPDVFLVANSIESARALLVRATSTRGRTTIRGLVREKPGSSDKNHSAFRVVTTRFLSFGSHEIGDLFS